MGKSVENTANFEQLFKDNYAKLCYFATQLLNDSEAANDVVQETFMTFWNLNPEEKKNIVSVNGFLYQSVKNASLNRLRRQKLEHSYLNKQDVEPIEDAVALNLMIKSEVIAEINKVLETLPASCQQIFRMGYLEGLKNHEIAEALDISINTVKTQKKRGLQLLKMRLNPDFFAIGFFGVIGVVQHHALGEQGGGGLTEFHEAQVVHDLGPEAAVKQVQNGMFNAADVLVHGHPVIAAFVSHRVCVVTNITREIPAGIDEGVHGVCLAARGFTALGAFAFIECSAFGQRVAAAIGHQVFGQHHGQVGFRYGNIATGVAVNHGDGGAPIALTADQPVRPGLHHAADAIAADLRIEGRLVDGLQRQFAQIIFAEHDIFRFSQRLQPHAQRDDRVALQLIGAQRVVDGFHLGQSGVIVRQPLDMVAEIDVVPTRVTETVACHRRACRRDGRAGRCATAPPRVRPVFRTGPRSPGAPTPPGRRAGRRRGRWWRGIRPRAAGRR